MQVLEFSLQHLYIPDELCSGLMHILLGVRSILVILESQVHTQKKYGGHVVSVSIKACWNENTSDLGVKGGGFCNPR